MCPLNLVDNPRLFIVLLLLFCFAHILYSEAFGKRRSTELLAWKMSQDQSPGWIPWKIPSLMSWRPMQDPTDNVDLDEPKFWFSWILNWNFDLGLLLAIFVSLDEMVIQKVQRDAKLWWHKVSRKLQGAAVAKLAEIWTVRITPTPTQP